MPNPQSAVRSPQSIWAIVPVKPLHESKRRLAHILSAEERADLIHQILTHTLLVLNQSGLVDRILVVSRDERVLATARLQRADVLVETATSTTDAASALRAGVHGLNSAVTQAARFAAESGATAVLILPADLPFIEKQDVAIMVSEKQDSPHVVICSDDHGTGTNALLISPPGNFTFRYGPGSFRQHLHEAQKRGRSVRIIQNANIRFDLDTETDWHNYQLTINYSPLTINH